MINLRGLAAAAIEVVMIEPENSTVQRTHDTHHHRLMNDLLAHIEDRWVSVEEAMAMATECGSFTRIPEVWKLVTDPSTHMLHPVIFCAVCLAPLRRASWAIDHHGERSAAGCDGRGTMRARLGFDPYDPQDTAIHLSECTICLRVFWDTEEWKTHTELHI